MTISELDKFLRTLFSDISGHVVLSAQKNTPKPSKPYLSLLVYAQRSIGQDEIMHGENEGELVVSGIREVTARLHWIGEGAIEGLCYIEQKIKAPTVVDRCFASGVAIYDSNGVTDISGLLDGADWEERANIDFTVGVTRQLSDYPGIIEEVNLPMFGLGNDQVIHIDGKEEE